MSRVNDRPRFSLVHPVWVSRLALAVVLLGACDDSVGSAGGGTQDGDAPQGGRSAADARLPDSDARLPDADPDARVPDPDAHAPGQDARVPDPDPDARSPDPDANLPDPDARSPDPDARAPDPDARAPGPDARLPDPGPDADGDGVADADDNCVAFANAAQVDADLDGAGDACDAHPGRFDHRLGPGALLLFGGPSADATGRMRTRGLLGSHEAADASVVLSGRLVF